MKIIDTLQIPFPKNADELAALDATREIPYLKALCNRRFIHTPGKNPTPQQIIPIIEARLNDHLTRKPKTLSPYADIFVEWEIIRDDLSEFLANLRSLIPQKSENPEPSITNRKSTPTISPMSPIGLIGPIPQSTIPRPKPSSTPRHFHVSNAESSKTSAISTPPLAPPKTFGHFHDSSQKNLLAVSNPRANNRSSSCEHQSSTSSPSVLSESSVNPVSRPERPANPSRPRIQPLLSTFSPETKEAIIAFCEETDSYKQAAQKIHEHLGIKISTKSLCKLYTGHNIAEDAETREELEAAANCNPQSNSQSQNQNRKDIRAIAKDQLELRLLELSARRDHDTSQLKELFQIITRLEALALSERRVIVAEKREARMNTTQQPQPHTPKIVSPEEMTQYVKCLLGKEITLADDLLNSRGSRGNEALADSAPHAPDKQSASGESQKVGPAVLSGPRAHNHHPTTHPPTRIALTEVPNAT